MSKIMTKSEITKCTGYDFTEGTMRFQNIKNIQYRYINGAIYRKVDCLDWNCFALVFEADTEEKQALYISEVEIALENLKNCKKFKFEMTWAMDKAMSVVYGNSPHHNIGYEYSLKVEIVGRHASIVCQIEKHLEELLSVAKNIKIGA